MFELVINGLAIDSFPTFAAAYDKMNTFMRKNGYTIFRVGYSYDAIPLFDWHKDGAGYVIVEIRDT